MLFLTNCVRGLPIRWLVIFNIVLSVCASVLLRVNLNVAIVSMVKNPNLNTTLRDGIDFDIEGFIWDDSFLVSNPTNDTKFDWSAKTQGIILGSFFWRWIEKLVMQFVI